MTDRGDVPRVLYVAGYGRSGSTILDVLLGAHPAVFGAGEVTHVFRAALHDEACACGAPVAGCPFWGPVLDDIGVRGDRAALEAARRATAIVDDGTWRPRRKDAAAARAHADVWLRLLRAIGTRSGARIIVDSSKTTRMTRNRPAALADAGVDVTVIQLTRHPAHVLASALRGSNQALAVGSERRAGALLPWRVALSWAAANRLKRPPAALRISYEALLERPEATLGALLGLVAAEADPILPYLEGAQPLPAGHGIAGNRFRQAGAIVFRRQTTAPAAPRLPAGARAALRLVAPLTRGLGYDESR